MASEKEIFNKQGFLDPFQLFEPHECGQWKRELNAEKLNPPIDWDKGYAVNSRLFFDIANHPAIIQKLKRVLGNDILLWGASLVTKPAGAMHPWHCDIESTAVDVGETASVWIGLENTTEATSIELISFSHHFTKSIQQIGVEKKIERSRRTTTSVLQWAKELNSECVVKRPQVQDGSALLFHGKIWHASHNRSNKPRTAILLQYASPEAKIRIPHSDSYDWPFHQLQLPKPPCILLSGDDRFGVNRIVSGPVSSRINGRLVLSSNRMHQLTLPLQLPESINWKPFYIFNGKSSELDNITCHVSALRQGLVPHPPHTHREEELLMVLSGEVDVILPEVPTPQGDYRHRLKAGQFVYYPAQFPHTLESTSENPANYLMLKWYSVVKESAEKLPFLLCTAFDLDNPDGLTKEIRYKTLFEGPTSWLKKLHCHTTILQPGASYPAHIDPYDVAIIILEGKVESLGESIEAGGVIYYPSGQPHGMSNPSDQLAKYVVFEFHGSRQLVPGVPFLAGKKELAASDTKDQLKRLQKALEQKTQELSSLRTSYSWKFGRFITKSAVFFLDWIPLFKKWILRANHQNIESKRRH